MKQVRWIGVPIAGILAAAGVFSVAAAPLAPAAAGHDASQRGARGTRSREPPAATGPGYADIPVRRVHLCPRRTGPEPSYNATGIRLVRGESGRPPMGISKRVPPLSRGAGRSRFCSGTTQTAHWAWWENVPGSLFEVFKVNAGDQDVRVSNVWHWQHAVRHRRQGSDER